MIYDGRDGDMDPYKARFASETSARTLADALEGADVFVGLSVARRGDAARWSRGWPRDPIIFALANPDPEILPEEVRAVRTDAIIATGRSDYPNQVNNVLGFPFIFRGALDVRATEINEEMKMAATRALAHAREGGRAGQRRARCTGCARVKFGADYLIPKPFDPRVLLWVAPAVAWAAVASGVAQRVHRPRRVSRAARGAARPRARHHARHHQPRACAIRKRIVFPEGEEPKIIRAARILVDEGIAHPDPARQPRRHRRHARRGTRSPLDDITIEDPATSARRDAYAQYLWQRRQRKGLTLGEAQRRLYNGNYFGS